MKINKAEILRQTVLVSLLLGMVVGAWYFVFRPRDRQDADMRLQIAAKQKQLQKLNRVTATIGNLKDEIASLEKAIEFFRSKLPNEKEIDKVLEEVWRLAEANNLTTKGIYTARRSPSSVFVTEGSTQNEQPITMGFEGEFVGFYSFLQALEGQPRIMRIRSIGLESLDGKAGRIKADLEMSIFFEDPDSRKAAPCPKKT